jgi:hypothetical protein
MENQKKKDSKITLVDSAFALPGSEEEFGMKIADHKLICAVLDDHVDSIEDMIDQKILKTLQSDELANKVSEKVRADVAETYIQLAASLKGIEESISSINDRLDKEDKKIILEVERLDLRIDFKRDQIKDLRDDFEENKKELAEIALHKPTLETIQSIFKFFTWKENKLRIIAIIIGIFLLFSSMVIGIYFIMRKSGWITAYSNKRVYSKEQYDFETRIHNASIRGYVKPDLSRYTKLEQDSINDAMHEKNIQDIYRSIKERNNKSKSDTNDN